MLVTVIYLDYVKKPGYYKFATLKDSFLANLLPKEAEKFTSPPSFVVFIGVFILVYIVVFIGVLILVFILVQILTDQTANIDVIIFRS